MIFIVADIDFTVLIIIIIDIITVIGLKIAIAVKNGKRISF